MDEVFIEGLQVNLVAINNASDPSEPDAVTVGGFMVCLVAIPGSDPVPGGAVTGFLRSGLLSTSFLPSDLLSDF